MAFSVKVKLDLPKADQVIKNVGLDESGAVQRSHTANVLRRIQKYMWFKSGAAIKKMIAATDIDKPEIIIPGPESRFLYHGLLMLGDETNSAWARKGETKHVVNVPLNYNKEKNPLAGPYPDRALVANEGDILVSELQAYIDRRAKGGSG